MSLGTKRYSDDARLILIRLSDTFSSFDIARLTGVPQRSVQRVLQEYARYGTVEQRPSAHQRGRPRLLEDLDQDFLLGLMARSPDTFLDEFQAELERVQGVSVSRVTVWRALNRMGYTLKKITKTAMERSEQARALYNIQIGMNYTAEQLVFVDESSCDRRTTYRNKAWAFKGHRIRMKTFFHRGKRYSVLPALSLDGILCTSIVEGSFNTVLFADFIELLLHHMQPFPGRNSVIVMDNCRIHKAPYIQGMIRERGMRVVFLPPYSPDFNPIELAFSKIKAEVKREGSTLRSAMDSGSQYEAVSALNEAVYSVTPQDAHGWYHKCGYL